MNGQDLLKYATNRLNPADSDRLVSESGLHFLVQGNWYQWQNGALRGPNGVITAGIGQVQAASFDPDNKHLERPTDAALRGAGVSNVQPRAPRTIPTNAVREAAGSPFIAAGTQGTAAEPPVVGATGGGTLPPGATPPPRNPVGLTGAVGDTPPAEHTQGQTTEGRMVSEPLPAGGETEAPLR